MLIYFGSTFFSVMKIFEGNNSSTARKAALLLSYVLFVVNIVLPCFLITLIYRRFQILAIKEAKQSFNALLTHIDKASRYRVGNPAYFFVRRLITAVLLTLPINNTMIFLQYVFVLMSSHAYVLYLVAMKPYQTGGINSYVLANETFYSALIIAIFIFSDATPELNIKFGAGVALMVSLVLLVLSNIIINIWYVCRGKASIKAAIKSQKEKRREKEALERAETEERRLKAKKQEEEFTKLPDETQANISVADAAQTSNADTLKELNEKSEKKPKRKGKGKKGAEDDNLAEGADKSDDPNVVDGGSEPGKKKRKRRSDKDKNNRDDVTEGTMGTLGGENVEKKKKKKKDKKAKDKDIPDGPAQEQDHL